MFTQANAQVSGCTDPKSPAFNPSATVNDGSCTYNPTTIIPEKLGNLPAAVRETSGLMFWNGLLWTHNDSGSQPELTALDPESRSVVKTLRIGNAGNVDWEDIARDDTFLYIGDFGNNNGNRTNLRIYKVPLSDLNSESATAEVISFSYSDQEDFSSKPNNNDYDAEAMIAVGDSLYIFSKNWVNLRTRVYSLPKTPGSYVAQVQGNIYADGMITGADFNPQDSVVLLCGYNKVLQPFFWLLWDFRGADYFGGNKRKINFNLPFHQIEGVVWKDADEYWLSNEEFTQIGNIPAALHTINTDNWITKTVSSTSDVSANSWKVFPNPFKDSLTIQAGDAKLNITKVRLYSSAGQLVLERNWQPELKQLLIHTEDLPSGTYIIAVESSGQWTTQGVVHGR
jgi:hypothetical protein